jgi:hypothetical protein
MAAPLILLPPSEGKSSGGRGVPWAPGTMRLDSLDESRLQVLAALARAMGQPEAARAKLLGVKGDALAAASLANASVMTGPTRRAIDRYTGVLYGALDHASLPTAAKRRLSAQVVIASGAFGLVSPGDPIPEYKLKMGAALAGLGKLSTWWRPHIDATLAPLVARRTVWNLLPNEHSAAWSGPGGSVSEISVRFLDDAVRNGTRSLVMVSHWNKLLKGALVRHLLISQLSDPAGLVEFDHPLGYRYRPDLTEVNANRTIVSLVARHQ